jgi:hypothetical protein
MRLAALSSSPSAVRMPLPALPVLPQSFGQTTSRRVLNEGCQLTQTGTFDFPAKTGWAGPDLYGMGQVTVEVNSSPRSTSARAHRASEVLVGVRGERRTVLRMRCQHASIATSRHRMATSL